MLPTKNPTTFGPNLVCFELVIRTKGLAKFFKDPKGSVVKAVDGVDFEAHPGKIFGLLGVNGAGKTTILRILSTMIAPTAGTAEVNGFDVQRDSEKVRASIGFLSGSTALYGRLNAIECLQYFGGLYGLEGALLKSRIEYVVEKMRLHEFQDRQCDKMSTGQKQRVSIARAILHDPPVLFFDEPTSGLDVVSSQTVMEFIEETRDHQRTVIFSTHIMTEAERLCDEIVMIHQGQICGKGSVPDLLAETGQTTLEKAFLQKVGYRKEAEQV